MTEQRLAEAIGIAFIDSLPVLIPLMIVAILFFGTIFHLIAEEREYRRWRKEQDVKLQAVLTPVPEPTPDTTNRPAFI